MSTEPIDIDQDHADEAKDTVEDYPVLRIPASSDPQNVSAQAIQAQNDGPDRQRRRITPNSDNDKLRSPVPKWEDLVVSIPHKPVEFESTDFPIPPATLKRKVPIGQKRSSSLVQYKIKLGGERHTRYVLVRSVGEEQWAWLPGVLHTVPFEDQGLIMNESEMRRMPPASPEFVLLQKDPTKATALKFRLEDPKGGDSIDVVMEPI